MSYRCIYFKMQILDVSVCIIISKYFALCVFYVNVTKGGLGFCFSGIKVVFMHCILKGTGGKTLLMMLITQNAPVLQLTTVFSCPLMKKQKTESFMADVKESVLVYCWAVLILGTHIFIGFTIFLNGKCKWSEIIWEKTTVWVIYENRPTLLMSL